MREQVHGRRNIVGKQEGDLFKGGRQECDSPPPTKQASLPPLTLKVMDTVGSST